MKKIVVIGPFNGRKFAARYGLTIYDFSMNGDTLNYPDSLPDFPIFEGDDPPKKIVTLDEIIKRIEDLEGKVK